MLLYSEYMACTNGQAFFNVMLREFGVEGVRVQEVVSLDKEMMDLLPHVPRCRRLSEVTSDLEDLQQTSLRRDISLSLA
jgi:Ubiquitin carboxyl-terminal hydrolase, family 1